MPMNFGLDDYFTDRQWATIEQAARHILLIKFVLIVFFMGLFATAHYNLSGATGYIIGVLVAGVLLEFGTERLESPDWIWKL